MNNMEFPCPSGKIQALLYAYKDALKEWWQTPDVSTEYNYNGYTKYRISYVQHHESLKGDPHSKLAVDSTFKIYRVETALADDLIRAKALEKALAVVGIKVE